MDPADCDTWMVVWNPRGFHPAVRFIEKPIAALFPPPVSSPRAWFSAERVGRECVDAGGRDKKKGGCLGSLFILILSSPV